MNANTASRTERAMDSGSNVANVSWSTLAFDSDSKEVVRARHSGSEETGGQGVSYKYLAVLSPYWPGMRLQEGGRVFKW